MKNTEKKKSARVMSIKKLKRLSITTFDKLYFLYDLFNTSL
jgi:hypothetical protein